VIKIINRVITRLKEISHPTALFLTDAQCTATNCDEVGIIHTHRPATANE